MREYSNIYVLAFKKLSTFSSSLKQMLKESSVFQNQHPWTLKMASLTYALFLLFTLNFPGLMYLVSRALKMAYRAQLRSHA